MKDCLNAGQAFEPLISDSHGRSCANVTSATRRRLCGEVWSSTILFSRDLQDFQGRARQDSNLRPSDS